MSKLKKVLFWIVSIYLMIIVLLYFFQHKIIFQPEKLSSEYIYQFDHTFKEIFLTAEDGIQLNGLHFTTQNPKGVLLYFHGNRGSLRRWGKIATFFVDKQYDVIIMDYRGYGKNEGTITEQLLYADAQLFYTYAKNQYSENQITVYGRSLGTGIGVKTASENNPKQLILETPYYSIKDVAHRSYPWLPTKWLMKTDIPSYQFINKVQCPITIFHGTSDRVVPYDSGKVLFEEITQKRKQLITIQEGAHNNLINFGDYHEHLNKIL
ncbi:alpha/beta hydrolase [Aquimarina sp. Aq107]|uniref:alpha/beta hydrolase n=1 Tax=Aquimarina sp. Aq107 TaxID=1191912 RepID=UPI000D54F98C|nr:alpha/beta fold hydrolase [Aquimarina sp. Aq107]